MTDCARYAAASAHAGIRLTCPLCEQDLIRVTRRPVDRLLSFFFPVYRYRCRQHDCQWEGTLRLGARLSVRKPVC